MNCQMPALKTALEKAGFTDVRTVISSGNAVFSARAASEAALEKKCEVATKKYLGREFMTIVRSIDDLAALLKADHFAKFDVPAGAKKDVTFLKTAPQTRPKLPIDLRGARILALRDREAYTYHIPQQADPAFMVLIEKTFGKEVTTRTWETVGRIVKAGTSSA